MSDAEIIDMDKQQAAELIARLKKLKREIDGYRDASSNFLNDSKIFANVIENFSARGEMENTFAALLTEWFGETSTILRDSLPGLVAALALVATSLEQDIGEIEFRMKGLK